jgi:type I restriction enzyme S subunit
VGTTFDAVAEVISGSPFPSKCFNETGDGLPLVRIRDVVRGRSDTFFSGPFDERFLIQNGRWLVGMDGEFNIAKWRGGQALLNQRVASVYPRDQRVDHDFLGLVIASPLKEIEAQTSSTTVKHLSAKSIRAIPIALPGPAEQRRIVDVMAAVDTHMEALTTECLSAQVAYRNALSLLWLEADGSEASSLRLGDVMALDIRRVVLEEAQTYASAGVLGAGGGLMDRGPIRGDETAYAALNVLSEGQVVMRKLTAWEGPITVVDAAFHGFVASSEFPTFTLGPEVQPNWMRHVCRTERLWAEMKNRVTGSVQRRKRLNPDQLLDVTLPIPSRAEQRASSDALDCLEAARSAADAELARLRMFRSTLLSALLNQELEIPESYDSLLEVS